MTGAEQLLAAADPALPHLADALMPAAATAAITGAKHFAGARVRVARAALLRHKPGRRAVIDYSLDITWPDGRTDEVAAIGKMRASRPPRTPTGCCGSCGATASRATVPMASACLSCRHVPALGLWLQRRVPGTLATVLLTTTAAAPLARRIAEAAHKLHHAGVVPEKTHGPADELAILERVLAVVRDAQPARRAALDHLLGGCRRLVATLEAPATGIHRDFYADQIVVDGARLHLLDFDLYCAGHAARRRELRRALMEQRVRERNAAARLRNEASTRSMWAGGRHRAASAARLHRAHPRPPRLPQHRDSGTRRHDRRRARPDPDLHGGSRSMAAPDSPSTSTAAVRAHPPTLAT
jgi:hypothetical protein